MAPENVLDGLTDEQKAKARACTTPEELVDLAKSEGIELSDEQLEAIAGGSWRKCSVYEGGGCTNLEPIIRG